MDMETLRRRCIDAYVANYERHLKALHIRHIERLTERLQEWSEKAIDLHTAEFAKELRSGGNVAPEEIAGKVERFRVLEGKRQAHISKHMIDRVKKEGQAEIAEQVARMKAVYEKSEIILF